MPDITIRVPDDEDAAVIISMWHSMTDFCIDQSDVMFAWMQEHVEEPLPDTQKPVMMENLQRFHRLLQNPEFYNADQGIPPEMPQVIDITPDMLNEVFRTLSELFGGPATLPEKPEH